MPDPENRFEAALPRGMRAMRSATRWAGARSLALGIDMLMPARKARAVAARGRDG